MSNVDEFLNFRTETRKQNEEISKAVIPLRLQKVE